MCCEPSALPRSLPREPVFRRSPRVLKTASRVDDVAGNARAPELAIGRAVFGCGERHIDIAQGRPQTPTAWLPSHARVPTIKPIAQAGRAFPQLSGTAKAIAPSTITLMAYSVRATGSVIEGCTRLAASTSTTLMVKNPATTSRPTAPPAAARQPPTAQLMGISRTPTTSSARGPYRNASRAGEIFLGTAPAALSKLWALPRARLGTHHHVIKGCVAAASAA